MAQTTHTVNAAAGAPLIPISRALFQSIISNPQSQKAEATRNRGHNEVIQNVSHILKRAERESSNPLGVAIELSRKRTARLLTDILLCPPTYYRRCYVLLTERLCLACFVRCLID